ncbi:Decaprenyl diphosphate synthase-like protein [Hygrophoropsis aurantiaca]|uniref:Decaprenyl diphosphate synthase-like protein n=1 Tax=Hygrophoropsis aurantiaca TaxID=72124 RepID=A0ACB8A0I4_9AGAM|nr:Decaprenyl diphosphate synthase-like protein [Hygrophoropsis aurantiaca]
MSMLSWLKTQLALLLLAILVKGPIPRHIAFEMDGNRRYARKNGKKVEEGHSQGYVALNRAMKLCELLKVRCVTIYAFSIENFNRSSDEVDAIMKLTEEKLREVSQPGGLLEQYGMRLCVLGKRELLSPAVQAAAEEAENRSRHNDKITLNLCMPYTSQHEITTAVQSVIRNALHDGDTHGLKITEQTIDDHLMTSLVGSPPLDVFVRTSGVKRLSGFLQWQCCENTQIQMIDPCWPEFGLLDLLLILLNYQRKVWATGLEDG